MKNLGRFYDLTNGGQAEGAGTSSGIVNNPNEYQTAVVYDLISEGPIEGLVNGTDSIYLDKTAATIGSIGTKHNIAESLDVSFTASSLTVVDNVGSMFDGLSTNDGDRFITIAGAKKSITNGLTMVKGSSTVTAGSSFFNANDLYIPGTVDGMKQYVTVAGAGVNGGVLRSEIIAFTSATSVQLALPAVTAVSNVSGTVDKVGKIASITNATTAVISNISAQGTDARNVANVTAFTTTPKLAISDTPIYNHGAFQYAFMNGYRDQPLIQNFGGVGSASIIHSTNTEIKQTDLSSITGSQSNVTSGGYTTASGNATASPTTISASTMGVSNQPEIDKLKLTFKMPTLIASKKKSGDEAPCHIELRIFLGFKRAGDSSFTEVQIFGPTNAQISTRPTGSKTSNFKGRYGFNTGLIQAETKAPFIESFTINMEEFQPFSDFQVKVERVNPVNARHGDYDHTNPCTLTSIEAIVDDKLSYPLSAYGALIFDAQSFGKLPTRGYEVRGRLLQVPTNYFPRVEGNRSVAGYDRNVSTGADENSYQQWDGNFRGDKATFNAAHINHQPVYTDNPAWVFYDLVTNDRYGIGKYIDSSQIDKYELFRIARYCDELVSDGQGGTEPRFTCNLYLAQAAEALKVLKDVTSVFRGMMFWLNGEIQFSQNRFQSPVYTFSKANVIAGKFAYTSTKSQYRSNQVRVTWNDPDAMYKKAVEIVEDTNNILETGKIVSKDIVAFGCTSKGQAHRFGKWTLLSEIMETEGISFETSYNGGFLKPGDVVNVQDADRDHIRFSGRTSSSNTTTVINVDSAINLSGGNTFKLSIVFPSGGAFLGQESATVNSIAYIRGDYIPSATVGGSLVTLDTSAEVANAVDDSGNALVLNWNPNSRVETKTISSTGSSVTAIQVSSAFSAAPAQDMAWAIKEIKADGSLDDGSAKEYLVTGINESNKGRYEITGIKYEPSKFDLVDRGYALQQDQTIKSLPSYTEEVPVPKSFTLSLKEDINADTAEGSDVASTPKIIRAQWQHPTSTRTDSEGNAVTSIYEHLNYYEIEHNASGRPVFEKIFATKDTSFIDIPISSYGLYTVRIRTVNSEQIKSAAVQKDINTASNQTSPTPTPIGRLFTGGSLNQALAIDTNTGIASVGSSTYTFLSKNEEEFSFTSTGTANRNQAFSGMGASAEAYLLFDADATSDHLKAIELKTDTTAQDIHGNKYNFEYFAEVGASNAGISTATGTVSIASEEGTVTGSSTTFLTEYSVGDRFIVATGTTRFMAIITNIASDTLLELDTVVPRSYTGSNIFKQSFKPDVTRDTILAKILTDSSTVYSFGQIYAITAGITGADGADGSVGDDARAVNLTIADQTFEYDTNGANPSPSSATATATALNTSGTVYYEFFKNDVSVQNTTSNTYSYSAPSAYTSMPEKLEVQIREGSNSSTILARDQITISGLKAGTNAITTILSNEAHTLPTTSAGVVTYTDSGTDIEVWNGTTQVPYDGSSPYASPSFRVSASGSSITVGSASTVSTYTRRFADHNSMTQNNAVITYTIIVKNEAGVENTFTRKQTFAKSIQGADGASVTGATGPRTATGYIYYKSASASSPTSGAAVSTSSVAYNFSTSLLSGGVIGTGSTNWNQVQPTYTGSNSNTYWYAYFSVVESSFGGSQTITFSIPYVGQNFTGLVTFIGTNQISDGSNTTTAIVAGDLGSSGTTTIDGARITTGSIAAARITISGKDISDLNNDSGFTDDSTANSAASTANSAASTASNAATAASNAATAASNAQSTANSKTTASAAASAANSQAKTGGSVGGWSLSSTTITSGNITLNNSTSQIIISD
tara:strand:- start:3837 stop:9302 length:5466 start_codon:yes stop_codon:yes gene_type:complete